MEVEGKIHQGMSLQSYYIYFIILIFIELNNSLFARQKLDGQLQETQMVLSVN